MSARSAVLIPREGANKIRIQIGATTLTFTEGEYMRLMALLSAGATDGPVLSRRPLNAIPATARLRANRNLWDVADRIVPGLLWIVGLLFAAGALPV